MWVSSTVCQVPYCIPRRSPDPLVHLEPRPRSIVCPTRTMQKWQGVLIWVWHSSVCTRLHTRQEWGLHCNRGRQHTNTIGITLPSGYLVSDIIPHIKIYWFFARNAYVSTTTRYDTTFLKVTNNIDNVTDNICEIVIFSFCHKWIACRKLIQFHCWRSTETTINYTV